MSKFARSIDEQIRQAIQKGEFDNLPGKGEIRHSFETNRMIHAEWQRVLENFKDTIVKLNKRIADYNLEAPSTQFQLQKLNSEHLIEKITTPPD